MHVRLRRGFCTFAGFELGSVHEHVVELGNWHVVVRYLCFEERFCQYQMVLDRPVPEPLSSAVLSGKCVFFDVFGIHGAMFTLVVRCVWIVVRSNLPVEVSSNQHVCVSLPASVGVFSQFRITLLCVLVSVSRVWEVN